MKPVSSAIAFAVAAVGIATYSMMDVLMKGLSITSGAYSAVLWRSAIGVALLGPVFVVRRRPWPGREALLLHGARGATAGFSVLLFFWGLVRVPMAQGVALTFLAPLIALYFAAVLLGETIRRAAILGSVVASLGVLVIAAGEVQAHASASHVLGSLAILAASLFYAFSLILLRRQAQLADPLEVALFTSIVLGGLLLLGAPWFAGLPAVVQLPSIAAAAVLGSVSAMALAWAYGRAEAQVLAPVEYTAFVWSALFGWWVFGERVSLYTTAGASLIVAGCILAVRGSHAAPAPTNRGCRMTHIRPATSGDVPLILQLVRELAEFEREPDKVVATEPMLFEALFGPHPAAEAVIAELDGAPVGMALFFHNFSTWTGWRGIYLEDLYVTPEARGHGVGKALLRHIAALAVERGCTRFEWAVLDWNEKAIAFYRSMGAVPMTEWTTYRVTGDALADLAAHD